MADLTNFLKFVLMPLQIFFPLINILQCARVAHGKPCVFFTVTSTVEDSSVPGRHTVPIDTYLPILRRTQKM